jgi:hypothetical protein
MMATAASKAGCWGDLIMSHASSAPIVSNLKKIWKGAIITGRRAF